MPQQSAFAHTFYTAEISKQPGIQYLLSDAKPGNRMFPCKINSRHPHSETDHDHCKNDRCLIICEMFFAAACKQNFRPEQNEHTRPKMKNKLQG